MNGYNINSSDELIELLDKKMGELPDDHKKKLEQALFDLCIGDKEEINTAQISDERTIDIIRNYLAFQKDPMRPFNDDPPAIWFEAVLILQNIFQQRIF